jgi:hypothetical protein
MPALNRLTASFTMAAALALGVALPLGKAHASTLVTDGDFTQAIVSGSYQTFSAPATMGGWSVASGSVDLINTYWAPPPGGGRSVDLDGNSVGAISQDLGTLSAGTYKLSFYLSGNPDGPPDPKQLRVSFGGEDTDLSAPRPPAHTINFQLQTVYFTLSTVMNDVMLSFASLDSPSTNPYGPVIGDVSLTAVPLPASWTMMLLGFIGFGFVVYRGTKNRSFAAAG